MSTQDNQRRIEDGTAAVNDHDIDRFLRGLHPEFQTHIIMKPEQLLPQGRVDGAGALREYLNMLFNAFHDFHLETVNLQAGDRLVYQQVNLRGTHTGPLTLPDGHILAPTGFRVEMPAEVYHAFEPDGSYVASTSYISLLDIMRQFKL